MIKARFKNDVFFGDILTLTDDTRTGESLRWIAENVEFFDADDKPVDVREQHVNAVMEAVSQALEGFMTSQA